ncbi:hypothetical protein AA313_de0203353 [Arthrobotrys entomopaga]|nr:hypothetical protein AA313_de0203353 [Arthrobotrys entomopaga]
MPIDTPILTVATASAWSTWLTSNAHTSRGVLLTLAKKQSLKLPSPPTRLTYDEALEEALCHGWIDGVKKPGDENTFSVRFCPRGCKSVWSKRNVGIISRLEGEGRMLPSGIAAVDAAKKDGRWENAYAGSKEMVMHVEFLEALEEEEEEGAKEMYESLTSQNRYAIYWRLQQVKTESGRRRKAREFVEMLARGETLHPQKQKIVAGSKVKKGKRVASDDDGEKEQEVVTAKKRVRKVKKEDTHVTTVEEKVEQEVNARREGLRQRKPKS